MKKQVQKEKRGDYGFPYFGGGGFLVLKRDRWIKVGKVCAAADIMT